MSDDILLEARNITKRYPGNIALDDVTLRVHRNRINVLIGENGAGKSTLMRILAGVETPDAGELILNGQPVTVQLMTVVLGYSRRLYCQAFLSQRQDDWLEPHRPSFLFARIFSLAPLSRWRGWI